MTRAAILVLVVACLALAGIALAQPGDSTPPPLHTVEPATASGGGYRLAGLVWQIDGAAEGGHYRLFCPAAPDLGGSGCCCTYLPMVTCGLH